MSSTTNTALQPNNAKSITRYYRYDPTRASSFEQGFDVWNKPHATNTTYTAHRFIQISSIFRNIISVTND